MKTIKMMVMVLICISFVGGCTGIKKVLNFSSEEASEEKITAVAAGIPESREYVVEAAEDDLFAGADFKIALISQEENSVAINVPLPADKADIQDWKICASVGYTDGQRWVIVPQDNYERDTTIEEGYAIAKIVLPKKGNGWYWIRVWGQNVQSGDWLLILLGSEYCRNDTAGNPGYEFLVHPASGCHQPVSNDYQIRR